MSRRRILMNAGIAVVLPVAISTLPAEAEQRINSASTAITLGAAEARIFLTP